MVPAKHAAATVIVAEENTEYRTILLDLLRHMQDILVVGVSPTANEAVPLCTRHQPDILLLDAGMKGSDALHAATAVRQASPRTTIVFLTAGATGVLRAGEYHRQADHVVSKSDIKMSLRAVIAARGDRGTREQGS